jgi:6-phosphogluconate dehydrogenase (decarboxylating)
LTNVRESRGRPISFTARALPPSHCSLLEEQTMDVGVVGFGEMGLTMVMRLRRDPQRVIALDHTLTKVKETEEQGAMWPGAPADRVGKFTCPRAVRHMLPAGEVTEDKVCALADLFQSCEVTRHSLFVRFRLQQEEKFSEKMLAALRRAFGGHAVRRSK